jgi:hypothetical protein
MPIQTPEETDEIIRLAIGATIAVALIPAFFSLGGVIGSSSAMVTDTGAGATTTLDASISEQPDDLQVRATRGNGLQLDESAVTSTATDNVTDGSWTLCAVGQLASDANTNATYALAAADNGTALLLFSNQSWVAYYQNASTGDTAKATLSASSPQSSLTPVCGRYDDTSNELVVMAGGTVSAPDTADATTDSRSVAHDWRGAIDELRVFDEAVANATLTAYASDPIQPFPSTQRAARMMFDEGSGSTTTVYFAGEEASIGTATWTDGVSGPGLSAGSDYSISVDPLVITVLSGGYVEGAPVVFVSWGGNPIPLWGAVQIVFVLVILVAFVRKLTDYP